MAIDKIQTLMITDEVSSSEFANSMVEVLENLIVKVTRQLHESRKIPGDVLK